MKLQPSKIERNGEEELRITWSDGKTLKYSVKKIRLSCPCANCRTDKEETPKDPMALPVLSQAEAQPIRILGMSPVGNYAYHINFSDGHNSGIFTFEHLRGLGEEAQDSLH